MITGRAGTNTRPMVFRPGVFDITRVTAGYDDENDLRVEFAGPVENVELTERFERPDD